MMHIMKKLRWGSILAILLATPLVSCQTISQLDQVPLNTPGRQFQERGALGTSCGITSQVESGRIGGGASFSSSGGC